MLNRVRGSDYKNDISKFDSAKIKDKPFVTIEISKYGNKILQVDGPRIINKDCPFGNLTYEDYFPELFGAKNCDTYEHVLDLLKKIKANPECEEKVRIYHMDNSQYPKHYFLFRGCMHPEKIDDMIAFVSERQKMELEGKYKLIENELLNFKKAINKLSFNLQIKKWIIIH